MSRSVEGVQEGSLLVSSQASKEEADAGEVDQRLAGGGQALVVLAHAVVATGPRHCALDHPPSWYGFECFRQGDPLELAIGGDHEAASGRPLDDLDRPAHLLVDPVQDRTGGGLIGPQMAQPREAPLQASEHEPRAIAVLPVGWMHDDLEQQAKGIDQDVPLASIHLLAAVIAVGTALFGRLDRLAAR